jgi:hypothetical protein
MKWSDVVTRFAMKYVFIVKIIPCVITKLLDTVICLMQFKTVGMIFLSQFMQWEYIVRIDKGVVVF